MWIARVNLTALMNTSTINEHLNGKYIFDDDEMHAALDEKVNEISLTLNNRHNLN
jgi:hypothetical protein